MALGEQYLSMTESELSANVARASELLDRLTILAVQATFFQEQYENGVNKVFGEIYPEACYISDELREMPNLRYRFSGNGFVPIQTLGLPIRTTFADIGDSVGKFNELTIFNAEDIEYSSKQDILEDVGVEIDDDENDDAMNEIEVSPETKKTLDQILTPGSGLRLYADFIIGTTTGEQTVGGIAVRSDSVSTHNIMDACNLNVSLIYGQSESNTTVPKEMVLEAINNSSRDLSLLISEPRFRRMGLARQKRAIESRIATINDKVRIDRFTAFISPEQFYLMKLNNGVRELYLSSVETSSPGILVHPIRLDSLELYNISQGKRIFSDSCLYSKYDGLCIVAEVEYKDSSEIVWVPISSQDADIQLFEKNENI